jgi:hypothetical protein
MDRCDPWWTCDYVRPFDGHHHVANGRRSIRSTTQESDNGLYRVSYMASTGNIPVNQMHEWTLHVENADGAPVEDATITVDGDMPQHGHGLPTSPRVTEYLGNGDYLVEGLKFQMGGLWLMDVTITANGQTDAVHFNMLLK